MFFCAIFINQIKAASSSEKKRLLIFAPHKLIYCDSELIDENRGEWKEGERKIIQIDFLFKWWQKSSRHTMSAQRSSIWFIDGW